MPLAVLPNPEGFAVSLWDIRNHDLYVTQLELS